MPRRMISMGVHLVWATKGRRRWLGEEVRAGLFAYLAGAVTNMRCRAILVGGWEDHVHLYVQLGAEISVSRLVTRVKSSSARWLKERGPTLRGFRWQRGFAAFSVDARRDGGLRKYIESQAEIHQKRDLDSELTSLTSAFALDRTEFDWE